ncbi:MAG TPA: lipopolysaccharide heptosyltransferase II [Candidatus Omnitrophota bacterium]|nr:lipopolysaccharide heptosyltransferase II [Candidatus Omnitrophota bacterium]HQJ14981.1 lipopolysaccharide heptosyltransferase II [Candidatus Omnitrophota bacterium]
MGKERKRIVIFNVNWLGDVLFSSAVIRNIRYNFPRSHIACIVPPRCRDVLEGNPYLDEIILFDERGAHKGIAGAMAFIRTLKAQGFDTMFLLHRSMTRAFIGWAAGIPERIGYATVKRAFLLTKGIRPPDIRAVHRIDYYLGVIRGAGLEVKDRHTDFVFSEQDCRAAEAFLKKNAVASRDVVIGLNPGGNWGLKRWPKENFAALADRLSVEYGAKIILTGSPQDLELSGDILSLMKHPAVSACGVLSLKQFAALCPRLSVFISADSGPLHIANAAGCARIIALFGPTDPKLTGPVPTDRVVTVQKNVGCPIPCYASGCSDNRCMKAISVDDVCSAVRSVTRASNT